MITHQAEGEKGLYWELPMDKSSLLTGDTTIFATTALPDGSTRRLLPSIWWTNPTSLVALPTATPQAEIGATASGLQPLQPTW